MIRLKDIEKSYNVGQANEIKVLKGISIEIDTGDLVAVVGKSGAGKSTLLHILACIDTYDSGEYYIDDLLIKDMSEHKLARIRNEKIGIVMQDFALVEDFTALQNVVLPLDFAKEKKPDGKKMALDALKQVDMLDLAKKKVKNMSGGQKQRVAIARAIVNNPAFILADEPTGALDSGNADAIMKLFKGLNKTGKTVIVVTHDREIADNCNRIITIADGEVH